MKQWEKSKSTYDQAKNKHEIPKNFKKREGHDFKRREFKPFNKHELSK